MDIVFYKLEDETNPVKDFIRSLDEKMRAKTVRTIESCVNKWICKEIE